MSAAIGANITITLVLFVLLVILLLDGLLIR
jgi:hypothetical protein